MVWKDIEIVTRGISGVLPDIPYFGPKSGKAWLWFGQFPVDIAKWAGSVCLEDIMRTQSPRFSL